jgi:hypothetical protein
MMSRFLLPALVVLLAGVLGAAAAEPASRALFDGKSTDAWRGFKRETFPAKGWVVENGALKTVVGGDRVDLITKDSFQDFDLSLEWKVSPGGNSGVMYDVAETEEQSYFTGPEMQVLDDAVHKDGKEPKTSAGSLYALIAPGSGKVLKPAGEWNLARLVKKGAHVEHWLNGVKLLEYELGSPALLALIKESKFKAWPKFATLGKGHIVLQHHGEEVWFRNIKISTK